jgi:hypothetical protein
LTPDGSALCEDNRINLQGGALTGSFFLDNLMGMTFRQGPDYWRIVVGGEAALYLSGDQIPADALQERVYYAFEPGTVVDVSRGVLYISPDDAESGTLHCTGPGSTWTVGAVGESQRVALEGVDLLGTCPGTPVSGELNGCFKVRDNACETLSGTLDGSPVATTMEDGHLSMESILALYEDGTFIKLWRTDMGTLDQGELGYAVIFTPLDGPHNGAVYCAGQGSTWTKDEHNSFSIGNISLVGRCADAPGGESVQGCLWE